MIHANDAIEELRTMGDLVRWGASSFNEAGLTYGHGTDNAFDEAFMLVRHVLHLPHDLPSYMLGARLTKNERRQIVDLFMERISSRKPAQKRTRSKVKFSETAETSRNNSNLFDGGTCFSDLPGCWWFLHWPVSRLGFGQILPPIDWWP